MRAERIPGALALALLLALLVVAGCASRQAEPRGDANVRTQWVHEVDNGMDFPAVVDGSTVYVGDNGDNLYAIKRTTGNRVWVKRFPSTLWASSLARTGKALYAGSKGGWLSALDPDSGRLIWRVKLDGEVKFAPALDGDLIYVTTTFAGSGIDVPRREGAMIYALSARDGGAVWQVRTDNFSLRYPVVDEETVYAGGGFRGENPPEEGGFTRLYAVDKLSGKVRWTRESEDGFVKDMHVADGVLAFVAYEDYVYGLDAASGQLLWTYPTGNWCPGFLGAGGRLYLGSANGFIHALDMRDGRLVWKYKIDGVFNYPVGRPSLDGGTIHVNTWGREIHAVDAGSGKGLWQTGFAAETRANLVARDGVLYLPALDGTVTALTAR